MLRLLDILEGIWGLLEDSVVDRRNGFRKPVFATLSPNAGCAVRTVVLRAVDRKRRCVRFYTDLRSPKVAQIRNDPRAALVFQDSVRQVELRAEAVVSLHRDDSLAERCWTTLPASRRHEFAGTMPPGSPAGAGELSLLTETHTGLAPDGGNGVDGSGWPNFAVADCRIGRLDWVENDSAGHRRAVFTWDRRGELKAGWLVP